MTRNSSGDTFSLIVPVVNPLLADDLFASVFQNTVIPHDIIVIDNTLQQYRYKNKPITYIRPRRGRWGVNKSWNAGISIAEGKYISILNDDVIVGGKFFERVETVLDQNKKAACVFPHTTFSLPGLRGIPLAPHPIARREGWAFTMKAEVLKKIPPIPHRKLKIFCGDDWFYIWSLFFGYQWWWDPMNCVYHKGGASVTELGVKTLLKKEKILFKHICEEVFGHADRL